MLMISQLQYFEHLICKNVQLSYTHSQDYSNCIIA